MKTVEVKNNKTSSDVWVGQTLAAQESYIIPNLHMDRWRDDLKVFTDISTGDLVVSNGVTEFTSTVEAYQWLSGDTSSVKSVAEVIITWSELKTFHMAQLGCYLNYIDLGSAYYIWACYRNQKFYIPVLTKSTSDCIDFETNFKGAANVPEAMPVRLATCRYGRKMHSRFISFHTADPTLFDNTNYLDVDQGDATYTMVDVDRNVTTNTSLCKETWVDWEPLYNFEIAGGSIYIPDILAGSDDDAWALHVIGAPDYPAEYGGSLQFISNPRLKWRKGGWLEEDESLNPVETTYVPTYHFTKMRWILKHPLGASSEFQIHLRIFR